MTELQYQKMARLVGLTYAPASDGAETGEIGCTAPNAQESTGWSPPFTPVLFNLAPSRPTKPEGRTVTKSTINGELIKPDFAHASEIYANDVAPANRAQKQAMKEAGDAWKEIKNEAHVHKGGFQKAMQIAEMEEADQQSWLRSFYGGLEQRGVGLYADLVDKADTNIEIGSHVKPPVTHSPSIELPQVH